MFKKIVALIALTATISFFFVTPVFAQTPTPTPTLSATTDAEKARDDLITKELSLNLPNPVDDPNYPVTFSDPSKKGVEITVDTKVTSNAPNPFLLPNLAIGNHTLIFKFTNKDGLVRILTKQLVVNPKPPIFDTTIKTVVIRPNQIVLTGKAIPQSTIMLVVNSTQVSKFTVNADGAFEITVPSPVEGKNNMIAFVVRNGFVSDASKSVTVEYKLFDSGAQAQNTSTNFDIMQEALKISAQLDQLRISRPTEFYGSVAIIVIAILLLLFIGLRKRFTRRKEERSFADLFKSSTATKTILDVVSFGKKDISRKEKDVPVTKEVKSDAKQPKDSKKSKTKTKQVEPEEEATTEEVVPVKQKAQNNQDRIVVAKPVNPKDGKQALQAKKQKNEPVVTVTEEEVLDINIPQSKDESVTTKQTEDESDVDEVSTSKKILSKDEFLKQFRSKGKKADK